VSLRRRAGGAEGGAPSRFPPVLREDWLGAPPELTPAPGGSITSPDGFAAAGVACGLKPSGALDLGLLRSRRPAVSALVDTASGLPAAPVVRNRGLDAADIQAVVVNSGNANAGTGDAGLADAHLMAARAAERLGLDAARVATSSTGIVGERLGVDRVLAGIEAAAALMDEDGGPDFAEAIRTTDAFPKSGAFRLDLPAGPVAIGAAAKGAGMISPRMATMLAYVTTDAAVGAGALAALTRAAAARSFDRISVDGQMSPSDTLIVMANGPGAPLAGADVDLLGAALVAVCRWLAVQVVKDGEGAEHAIRLTVRGARDGEEAEAVARAIADSPLVKTAAFGRDPNWGRIAQAVGAALAGRAGPPATVDVWLDGAPVAEPAAAAALALAEYDLEVALGRGGAEAEVVFSDLGHGYVRLNAEYHT
jgi:glutamate N-acetyltransferase/amino-acid N-acetyltransferase